MTFSRFFVSGALALALGATAAVAQDRSTLLVLDGSGSMWAELPEGRTRIEVARDVLTDFLTTRDATQPLGVLAYGHNRRGDCADIETLAPVGVQDGAALAGRLNALVPKGKTPLADALRRAASEIPRTAEEADIVLVTDGLETCGGDPCAVAAGLAAEGIKLRAHVVGFGLTEGEISQIACIAEATGGMVLATQSGAELADALKRTTQAAAPPPVILNAPAEVPARGTVSVTWTLPEGLAPASGPTDRITWAPATAPDTRGDVAGDVDPATGAADLPAPAQPGDWVLVYSRWFEGRSDYETLARAPVHVAEAAFALAGPPQAMAGDVAYVDWSGAVRPGDQLVIFEAAATRTNSALSSTDLEGTGGTAALAVPVTPGAHEFRLQVEGPEGTVVAARAPLEVIAPVIEIEMPAVVPPDQDFPVAYRGPSGGDTWLDITDPGNAEVWGGGYLRGGWDYVRNLPENAGMRRGQLRAPAEPGDYALRVVLATNDRVAVHWQPLRVAAGAEAAAAPAGPVVNEMGYELNIDRPGMDIGATPLASPDPALCQALCAETPGCKAWTYVQPGVQDTGAVCWTKFDLPPAQESDCCISGVMAAAGAMPPSETAATQATATEATAPAPAGDTDPTHGPDDFLAAEDVGYRCEDALQCVIEDPATGLIFILPAGWYTDIPTREAATAGGAPGLPRLSFFSPMEVPDTIVLNPHQWVQMNGPCQDVQAGQLCRFEPGSPMLDTGWEMIRRSIRDTTPRPSASPAEAMANVMQQLAQDDPAAAAAMGALMGAAQDAEPGQVPDIGAMLGAALGAATATDDAPFATCPAHAACLTEQRAPALIALLPAGWSVSTATATPDGRVAAWFTHRDPAGNDKRLGLNQPGGEACQDTTLGPLCEHTPYIATDEAGLIARTIAPGRVELGAQIRARVGTGVPLPEGATAPLTASELDTFLKQIGGN